MSDAKRKFRSKGPSRLQGKEPRASKASPGSAGRRKPRRSSSGSQGMDPFMMAGIVAALLMALGLLVVVSGRNKGVEDDIASNTKTEKAVTKGKKAKKNKKKYVTGNDPEVKSFLNADKETREKQAQDLEEMFKVMATATKAVEPELRAARENFFNSYKVHQSEDLLKPAELKTEQERSRQRKVIEALKSASQNCLKTVVKLNTSLKKAIRRSSLDGKLKAEMLKNSESDANDNLLKKFGAVVILCDLELKIIAFIEKNCNSMTTTRSGAASFSSSSLNQLYKDLRKQHVVQLEKAKAAGEQ